MGIWLRIPLVHPEAMDPDVNRNTQGGASLMSPNSKGDDQYENSDMSKLARTLDDICCTPGNIVESSVLGNADGNLGINGNVVAGQGGAKERLEEGECAPAVEDPWETWNMVRMLCEHKTG